MGFWDNYANQNIHEESIVPCTTQCCPQKFVMNSSWQVVAGDECLEVKVQCELEIEAIYPHPFFIPPIPIEPLKPCNLVTSEMACSR